MSKKLLLALLTVAPIFAQAQALVETTGKALLEQGTNAATSSIVEGTTRSALEATAAAQMHARPQISVTVTPAQTAVQIPPTQVPVASTPATRITGPSSILQIPTLPQGGENTSSLRNTLTTALSRVTKPLEAVGNAKKSRYYMEEFPTTIEAAFPDKMNPKKLAEAKKFYQEYLARPYDFAEHSNYLVSMIMLGYLGKPGDGSGQAIFNFLTSYDVSEEAQATAALMIQNSIYSGAEYIKSIRTETAYHPEFDTTESLRHGTALALKRANLLQNHLDSDIGFFPYITESVGARCLLMLEEFDLLNMSMERLSKMTVAINSKPMDLFAISNPHKWIWRKIMPYMELEYLSNHLDRYLPRQAQKGWPLSFPQWHTDNLGFAVGVTQIERNRFLEVFHFHQDNFPLGEKIMAFGNNIPEWVRAVEAKRFYRKGDFFQDTDFGGNLGVTFKRGLFYLSGDFFDQGGYKK